MKKYLSVFALPLLLATSFFSTGAFAADEEKSSSKNSDFLSVEIYRVTENGLGHEMGTITITESPYGLVFTPDLKEMKPGLYAFHVHTNPDCGLTTKDGKTVLAGAAGGHLDPKATNRHSTPWDDNGHLGDLPSLYVDEKGKAEVPVLAPKLKKLADVRGHSLMLHISHNGDETHAGAPAGDDPRFGCGVVR